MLESEGKDSGSHIGWNIHELKIRLVLTACLCALDEHTQNGKVDSLPLLAVDNNLALTSSEGSDYLCAKATAVLTVELRRQPNLIRCTVPVSGSG